LFALSPAVIIRRLVVGLQAEGPSATSWMPYCSLTRCPGLQPQPDVDKRPKKGKKLKHYWQIGFLVFSADC